MWALHCACTVHSLVLHVMVELECVHIWEVGVYAYEQARPSAALAPCCLTQYTTQAIHHHLGDCSWVTLPGYCADLVCTDIGHCHALACTYIHIASYTYTMLKELLGYVFP